MFSRVFPLAIACLAIPSSAWTVSSRLVQSQSDRYSVLYRIDGTPTASERILQVGLDSTGWAGRTPVATATPGTCGAPSIAVGNAPGVGPTVSATWTNTFAGSCEFQIEYRAQEGGAVSGRRDPSWPNSASMLQYTPQVSLLVGGQSAWGRSWTRIGARPGSNLSGYSLWGTRSVKIGDRVQVLSGWTGSNTYVEVGADSRVRSLVSGGTVYLRERATVLGDALSRSGISKQNSTLVTGSEQVVGTFAHSIPKRAVVPGTENVSVWSNSTRTLTPGARGDLVAYTGAVVRLSAGTYAFKSFVLDAGSVLEVDLSQGAVRLDVRDNLQIGDRCVVRLIGSADPFLFSLYTNQSTSMRIGTDADFHGALRAPNALVTVYSRTWLEGSIFADQVQLEPDMGGLAGATVNTPPVFTTTPSLATKEGRPWQYAFAASDADGDPLAYSVGALPSGMVYDTAARTLRWTPGFDQAGSYPLSISVTDGRSSPVPQSWTLVVADSNRAPYIVSNPATNVDVGQVYTYVVEALDDDGDVLTYSTGSLPSGMTFLASSREFSWAPTSAQVGLHALSVTVKDAKGDSAVQAWVLNVVQPNRPPVITSTPGTKGKEGEAYSYTVTATDADDDALTFTAGTLPSGVTFDAASKTFAWTPGYDQSGSYPLTVSVTDGKSAPVAQNWTLEIADVNRPPVTTSTSVTKGKEGEAYSYHVTATDPDGDALTFSAGTMPDGMTFDTPTQTFAWTPGFDQGANYPLSVSVTDGKSAPVAQNWTLEIADVNRPPVITSIPGTKGTEGEAYSYHVTATDPDGDTLTFIAGAMPDGMTFDRVTQTLSWTLGRAMIGAHEVSVSVRDGKGGVEEQKWLIQVEAARGLMDYWVDSIDVHGVEYSETGEFTGTIVAGILQVGAEIGEIVRVGVYINNGGTGSSVSERTLVGWANVLQTGVEKQKIEVLVSGRARARGQGFEVFVDDTDRWRETDEDNNVLSSSKVCCIGDSQVRRHGSLLPSWVWGDGYASSRADNVYSIPVVAPMVDDNGDGVVGSGDVSRIAINAIPSSYNHFCYYGRGVLKLLRGDNGTEIWSQDSLDTEPCIEPAIAELGGDVGKAVVALINDGDGNYAFDYAGSTDVVALSADGRVVRRSQKYPGMGKIIVSDINNDGRSEIISGVNVFSDSLRLLYRLPAPAIAVGDLSGYGEKLIICDGYWANSVGEVILSGQALRARYAAIGNVDGQVGGEVVLSGFGEVKVFDRFGVLLWKKDLDPVGWGGDYSGGYDYLGAPAVGRISATGASGVAVAGSHACALFDGAGNLIWSKQIIDRSGVSGVSAYDFDLDGIDEFLMADEEYLRVFNVSGELLSVMPRKSGTFADYPVIADVDADNRPDVLVTGDKPDNTKVPGLTKYSYDGIVDWSEVGSTWSQYSFSAADHSRDGGVAPFSVPNWARNIGYRSQVDRKVGGCYELSVTIHEAKCVPSPAVSLWVENVGRFAVPKGVLVNVWGQQGTQNILVGTFSTKGVLEPGAGVEFVFAESKKYSRYFASIDGDVLASVFGVVQSPVNDSVAWDFGSCREGNRAPVILSYSREMANAGALYTYKLVASDLDGDSLVYRAVMLPEGFVFDEASATIRANLAMSGIDYNLGVQVSDRKDSSVQSWVLHVLEPGGIDSSIDEDTSGGAGEGDLPGGDISAYKMELMLSSSRPRVGDILGVQVLMGDSLDDSDLFLRIGGDVLKMDRVRHYSWKVNRIGQVEIVAGVRYQERLMVIDTLIIVEIDEWVGDTPVAEITSPFESDELTGTFVVTGTVYSASLLNAELLWVPSTGDAPTILGLINENIDNDMIGVVDASLLENGPGLLRLVVRDRAGREMHKDVEIQIFGEKKLGEFSIAFSDLSLPLSGMDATATRTYDSRRRATKGDFGYGWDLDMTRIDVQENMPQGDGWHLTWAGPFSRVLQSSRSHRVTVRIPGLRTQEFVAKPEVTLACGSATICFSVPNSGTMTYEAQPGTYSKLQPADVSPIFQIMGGILVSEDNLVNEDGDIQPYDPDEYILTLADGSEWWLDQKAGRVFQIKDANGNLVQFNGNQIIHSDGRGIQLVRDGQNRVTQASDGTGRVVRYGYDADGNLSSVTDPAGNTTRFQYDASHYLTDIVDARGVKALRIEYDSTGRVVRQITAKGDTVTSVHDLANNREISVEPDGDSVAYTYNDRGDVTSKTVNGHTWRYTVDGNGKVTRTDNPDGTYTSSVYDADGNETESVDALGNRATRVFQAGSDNALSETDPLGRVTQFVYDDRGNLVRSIGPDGQAQTRLGVDAKGNVVSDTSATGEVTTYTYDASSHRLSQTDAKGRTTRWTYDARGNVLTETDAQGRTTRHTYDANGNRTSTIAPDGKVSQTEYTSFGKPRSVTDALGHKTQTVYDATGQATATIRADGSSTSRGYDATGNVTSTVDAAGRTTAMRYDAEGRLLGTTFADSAEVKSEYDAMGRRTASVDAKGNRTEYEYDAAGRDTLVRDAQGHVTISRYDAAGRKVEVVDALGRSTKTRYDLYDRVVKLIYPDGSFDSTEYDAAGRKTATVDAMYRRTEFGYDEVGQLTSVKDASGEVTRYGYDANGNRVSQTDAKGRVTSFRYDAMNRQTTKVYPDGAVDSTEYDAVGQVSRHIAPNGEATRFEYDVLGREVKRTLPSGKTIATTWNVDGSRASVLDERGLTRYGYDGRGRLASVTRPDGIVLTYAYDKSGQIVKRGTPWGEVRYVVGALGQIDTVVDSRAGAVAYSYDALGRTTSVSRPNGVQSIYGYTGRGLLGTLRHVRGASEVASFAYTFDASGLRTGAGETFGGVSNPVTWTHDLNMRLTDETRAGATQSWGYDAVSNRTSQTAGGASIAGAFDHRDRLTSLGNASYSWDIAGRLRSRTAGGATTSYTWADDDRLTRVDLPSGGSVRYGYDAQGLMVSRTTSSGTTVFVWDGTLPYGQVVATTSSSGALDSRWVYGSDRLAEIHGDTVLWLLTDGLGNVRAVTDSVGGVVGRADFDAWGKRTVDSGRTSAFGYRGEWADPTTGMVFLRARWMDPTTGRFVSEDPYIGSIGSPVSQHRFLYANDGPVNGVDPSGKLTVMEFSVATGILGALTAMSYTTYNIIHQGGSVSDNAGMIVASGVYGFAGGFLLAADLYLAVPAIGVSARYLVGLQSAPLREVAIQETIEGIPVAQGMARISSIRGTGSTPQVSRGKNIAVADFEIDGIEGTLVGISGRNSPKGTCVVTNSPQFETTTVGWPRQFDSEAKILEEARRFATPASTGVIRIFTENPACPSCLGVSDQFQKMFPGIRVIITSGPGRGG